MPLPPEIRTALPAVPAIDRSSTPPTLDHRSGSSLDLSYSQFEFDESDDELGAGGNAVVHRAAVPSLELTVALKRPFPGRSIDRATIENVLDEAQRWAKIDDHPYVADVFDWGFGGIPWVAIEYLDGGTLDERAATLGERQRLWTAYALADAVAYASGQRGVVHHDLKPQNVLFERRPGNRWDVPKVCDWGLSRELIRHDGSISQATPDYAAPEQFPAFMPDTDVGVHTDVYQLGVVCYELLTGEHPNHLRGDVPPPSTVDETVPAAVDDVIMQALAHERDERYRHPILFEQALADVLDGTLDADPSSSSTPSTGDRLDDVSEDDTGGDTGGASSRGDDLATDLAITLQEAHDGVTRELAVSRPERCGGCGGSGEVAGAPSARGESDPPERPCGRCDGKGTVTAEATVEVEIPAGIRDGQALGLSEQGAPAPVESGEPGDLLIEVAVADDPRFDRDGDDLHYDLDDHERPGETVRVPTLAGTVTVDLGADVDDGDVLRLADRGMPHIGADGHGDLYVTYHGDVATSDVGAWPAFGGNPARTGHRPTAAEGRYDTGDGWRFETNGAVDSSPAVVDGTVYVGSNDHHVYAVNATDGTEVWRCRTDGQLFASPTVVDGIVYVGSEGGSVYALDATDGTVRWRYETDRKVGSSPIVVDGTVYVGSHDHRVYALAVADGAKRWSVETDGAVFGSPAAADGIIYVGTRGGTLSAFDAVDGTTRWSVSTNSAIDSSPAVADGVVYVGCDDRHLHAVAVPDGSTRWRFETDGRIFSSPAVADETVYVGSGDHHVYAVDTTDGAERWRFRTSGRMAYEDEGPVPSSPAVADGVVYVGSGDQYVYALDAADGSVQGAHKTEEPVFSSPAVADGMVYVGSRDRHLHAFTQL
jgi:outer membrane protein assembly factor BamB